MKRVIKSSTIVGSKSLLRRLRQTGLSLKDIDHYYNGDTGRSIFDGPENNPEFTSWAEDFLKTLEDESDQSSRRN